MTARGKAPWLAAALAAAAVLAAFSPAFHAVFINWDDDVNILLNPGFRGLGWTQLRWMFTTAHMGPYQPLTWMSLGLDYLLWGLKPEGYHLVNVLLHAANAAVFCLLCRELLPRALPDRAEAGADLEIAALFAALLFAVHPLRAESVAWVTERRDVLSGLFYLLATLAYARRRIWTALLFFAAGLLSKAIGVTLPLIFVVLDVYPLRRLPAEPRRWLEPEARRVWLEKVPFLLLALVLGLVGAAAQSHVGATLSLQYYGVHARLAQAVYGLGFYVWKTVWPAGLMPLYEELNPLLWRWPYWIYALFTAAATAGAIRVRRSRPEWLALWLCYVLGLLPVLGLVKFGQYIAADRYTYLACLSWAALGGGVLLRLLDGRGKAGRQAVLGAAGVLCAVLGGLTWRQVSFWHDSESLWKHAISVEPRIIFAQNNLGTALAEKGKHAEAVEHYRAVLAMDSTSKFAHYNLGNALFKLGDVPGAVLEYNAALKTDPYYAQAHQNLAAALTTLGRPEEARGHFEASLRLNPNPAALVGLAESHNNVGVALIRQGRAAEAAAEFREAARLNPRNVGAINNLGAALSDLGRFAEAVAAFQQALSVDPRCAQAEVGWGTALFRKGDAAGAAAHYRAALSLDPNLPEAHGNLAVVLMNQKRPDEAEGHYRAFLNARPDVAEARFALGNILASRGQWKEAVEQYRETLRLQPSHAGARRNLESVLARSGLK